MSDPPAGEGPVPAKKAPRAAAAKKAPRAPAKKAPRAPRAPSRRPARTAPPELVQAVVFSLGDEEYALPIGQVQEVIAYAEPRAIAGRVSWVRGVINLRGKILPVCDLAERLGSRSGQGAQGRIVVVHGDDGAAGLIVGDVREVVTIAGAQLHEAKVTNDPGITAIAQLGERLVVLLDASALLAGANLGGGGRRA